MEHILRVTEYKSDKDTITESRIVGEVVRCANCKYLSLTEKGYRCPVGFFHPTEEDYCSKGERIDVQVHL